MTRRRYVTIFLAVCCMIAFGIAGTTLKSTLSTDPDDVIDFEYTLLPFGKDAVKEVKRESLRNQRSGGGGGGSEDQGTSGSLLAVLWKLLALLAALAALLLAYWYRDRLLAAILAGKAWLAARTPAPTGAGTIDWPTSHPANDIHEAWVNMVERANPEQPWTRTPAEVARTAVEAGMDSEAVGTITRHFEEVRYGNAPLTEERIRHAREWRERLDRRGEQ